jgi:hypothetical protein
MRLAHLQTLRGPVEIQCFRQNQRRLKAVDHDASRYQFSIASLVYWYRWFK